MPDPVAVNSMFARIARRYDVANRLLSGGIDLWWRRRLVSAVKRSTPQLILDLATGSGDVAFTLSRALAPTARITGVDFCEPMLKEAEIKKNQSAQYLNVSFHQADALALPFPPESFDAVTMSFGLRNMADRQVALGEIHRVLRPGSKLFLLEFSQPQRWFKPFYFFYLRRILPFVAGSLTGDRSAYVYLNNTIEQFPGRAALASEIQTAGFSQVEATGMTFGVVALHEAKK